MVQRAALSDTELPDLDDRVSAIATKSYIDNSKLRSLIIAGWERAVTAALEDHILSQEEERALVAYKDKSSLAQHDLDGNGAYTNVAKAGVIRDLLEGKVPSARVLGRLCPFVQTVAPRLRAPAHR